MPFQIIHTFEGFIDRFDYSGDYEDVLKKCLNTLKDMNIDGIVINVNTKNGYLTNDENWVSFIKGVRIAVKLGFRIWLYDEKGYPSGGAGGLTLKNNPELEAKAIKYHNGEYFITNIYEGTHAERNFREKRRYINLLEKRAVEKFAEITYERYQKELPEDLFRQVEAFFTDEPSLMTVVVDVLDGSDGNTEIASFYPKTGIPVNDKTDPDVPITPSIPYSMELNEYYFKLYGDSILDISPKVFEYSDKPSSTKCRFWEAVAKIYEENYSNTLSCICEEMNQKLTGHLLFEETPILNMAFHANPMRVLKHFQLPGIDLLSNVQENISIFGHKMVYSCAWQNSVNGIMTETSDFNEYRMGPKKPTEYRKVIAALYKQFALGTREFSFYYDFGIRKDNYGIIAKTIKNLCDFGKDLQFQPDCAVYCAYETVWAGFWPSLAKPTELYDAQPEFVKIFEDSILKMCKEFYHNNTQFILLDESSIDKTVEKGIKQIIIPECTVVSKKLTDYANEGKIQLFGNSPVYIYESGSLSKNQYTEILPISRLKLFDIPFKFSGNPIFTIFKDGWYFCFNPAERDISISADRQFKTYNPVTDENIMVAEGCNFYLAGDSAVLIKIVG